MSSGFWLQPSQLNDEFDEGLYSSESETEEEEQKQNVSRFDIDFDEEEEQKRVFKSDEQKLKDNLQLAIKILKEYIQVDNWGGVLKEWNSLCLRLSKSEPAFAKYGVPNFLVGFLVSLEDTVREKCEDEEYRGSITKERLHSLKLMSQKLKKWKNQSQLCEKMEEYRANPVKEEVVVEEEERRGEVGGGGLGEGGAVATAEVGGGQTKPKLQGRIKWMKRAEDTESSSESDSDMSWLEDSDEERRVTKKGVSRSKKSGKVGGSQKGAVKEKEESKVEGEEQKKEEEWTAEKIDAMHEQLVAQRGMKNSEPAKQVAAFNQLIKKTLEKANAPGRILKLLFSLVDAQFDFNPNLSCYLNIRTWKQCYNNIHRILLHLRDEKNQKDLFDGSFYSAGDLGTICGVLLAKLERLDDEFIKSLQYTQLYTKEYLARLRHENAFLKLAHAIQNYFESLEYWDKVAVVAARRLGHLYNRRDHRYVSNESVAPEVESKPQDQHVASTSSHDLDLDVPCLPDDTDLLALVPELCRLVCVYGENRIKVQATLQYAYHLALHDEYFKANIILSPSLQDEIQQMETPMKILYNRALVQVGLAAFRKGYIAEAHSILMEFSTTVRIKELLAQGMVNRPGDKTVEQEKQEYRRQVPYSIQINTELLEFAHLTSAMLLEVPNMASGLLDLRKRVISKAFRKAFDRQVFNGPPENVRDHIIAAAKALFRGDLEDCLRLLFNLDVWKIIPKAEQVKSILRRKVQDEALRTYLYISSQHYKTIHAQYLADTFSLPLRAVHSIVSKMMLQEEICAYWDQTSNAIVIHGQSPTKLQSLALHCADKLTNLVEFNDSQEVRQIHQKERWDGGDRQNQRSDADRSYRSNSNLGGGAGLFRSNAGFRTGVNWSKNEKKMGALDRSNMGGRRNLGGSQMMMGSSARGGNQSGSTKKR